MTEEQDGLPISVLGRMAIAQPEGPWMSEEPDKVTSCS